MGCSRIICAASCMHRMVPVKLRATTSSISSAVRSKNGVTRPVPGVGDEMVQARDPLVEFVEQRGDRRPIGDVGGETDDGLPR